VCALSFWNGYFLGLIFEQFTINMLNLTRSILRCEAYTPAKTLEGQTILQLLTRCVHNNKLTWNTVLSVHRFVLHGRDIWLSWHRVCRCRDTDFWATIQSNPNWSLV